VAKRAAVLAALVAVLAPATARAGEGYVELDTRAAWVPRPPRLDLKTNDGDDLIASVPGIRSMQTFGFHFAIGWRVSQHVAIPIVGGMIGGGQGGYRMPGAADGVNFQRDGWPIGIVSMELGGLLLETRSGPWRIACGVIPGFYITEIDGTLHATDGDKDASAMGGAVYVRGEARVTWHSSSDYAVYAFVGPTLLETRGVMNGGTAGLGVAWGP
jgi:hypothetical protein